VLLFSPPCGLRSKRDGGPRSALVIFSITDHFVIGEKRSNVLIRLIHSLRRAKPDIQDDSDLALLGEVGSVAALMTILLRGP
jgi:hypothetical protein